MKIVKTTQTDPIPLTEQRPHIATIMMRFVVLLALAITVLLLAWAG